MSIVSLADGHPQSSFNAIADIPAVALEAIPMAVYVVNADARILRYNTRALELWGRTPRIGDPEELYCGSYRLFRLDGSPLLHAETPMAEVLMTGEARRGAEVQIEREDGGRSIVLVNIEPLHDADGRLAGAINCFLDITEKKRLEGELVRSEAFLQAVVDATPECIKVVAADGSLVRMNSAGLGMIGAPDFETVDGASTFDIIAPEHREIWKTHHRRVVDGERLNWEFDLIGLGGIRRHMETHAVPMVLPDGRAAQLAVTRDISHRKRNEAALAAIARLHSDILQALPVAVYTTDSDGLITFYNDAAVGFSGNTPRLGEDAWCVSYRLYWPDGTPMPHDQCPMAMALREQRPIHGEIEAVAERPDGTRVPFLPFITPLFDSDGELIGAVNMLVDITERKRAEERQKIFVDELNHRVRNTLSVVHSLAAQTARRSSSISEFAVSFEARVSALARVHDLLSRTGWEQASLFDVVVNILKPYGGVALDGPPIALPPARTLALAMVLHELATNAAKHGSLSVPGGSVAVEWTCRGEGDNQALRLEWREIGGPPVEAPSVVGFGSTLIDRTVRRDLGGTVDSDFAPSGLRCAIAFPLQAEPAAGA